MLSAAVLIGALRAKIFLPCTMVVFPAGIIVIEHV